MKRNIRLWALTALALIGLTSCSDDEKIMDPSRLPEKAQNFITNNFDGATITNVTKEYDDFTIHYDAYLSDGSYVEFDKDGRWREVENRTKGVPTSIIPVKIMEYVTTNYADNFVIKIEHTDRHYEVELNNDFDLYFSHDGNFIRIEY